MKKYIFILGMTVMALFAACSTDEGFDAEEAARLEKEREAAILLEAISDSEVPITIGTGTRTSYGVTRAPLNPDANGLFTTETGKYLGVFCLAVGKQTGAPDIDALNTISWSAMDEYRPLVIKMSNIPAKVTNNTTYSDVVFLNETDLANSTETPESWFYPMNDWVRYNFYAYYPRQEAEVNGEATLSFTKNQVVETYYEIDGSQDILWAIGNSTDETYSDALPYCAKYFRKKTAALAEQEASDPNYDDDIANYYPKFRFDHKLTQFVFNVKAASAADAAVLNAKNFKVKKAYISNVLYNVKLIVASKSNTSRNGVLMKNSSDTKALNIKLTGADVDRFDQNGDDTADNPLAISSTASDTDTKTIGYLMLPPTLLDTTTLQDYQLVIEVEYDSDSGTTTDELKYILTPPSGGFLAGYKYNVNLTFYAPTETHARASLNGWTSGADIDL